MIVGSALLGIMAELLNSATEDRISLENHDRSKPATGIGSLAVLVSLINAIVLWKLVLML